MRCFCEEHCCVVSKMKYDSLSYHFPKEEPVLPSHSSSRSRISTAMELLAWILLIRASSSDQLINVCWSARKQRYCFVKVIGSKGIWSSRSWFVVLTYCSNIWFDYVIPLINKTVCILFLTVPNLLKYKSNIWKFDI